MGRQGGLAPFFTCWWDDMDLREETESSRCVGRDAVPPYASLGPNKTVPIRTMVAFSSIAMR